MYSHAVFPKTKIVIGKKEEDKEDKEEEEEDDKDKKKVIVVSDSPTTTSGTTVPQSALVASCVSELIVCSQVGPVVFPRMKSHVVDGTVNATGCECRLSLHSARPY